VSRSSTTESGAGWLAEAQRIDRAVYTAVATTATPHLDDAMRRLSRAADHSKISIGLSALLALAGGPRGRRAAASGLAAIGATSAVVNLGVKPLARRRRPDRDEREVAGERYVPMPGSRSFPSGHTAAAVAFASSVSEVLPVAGLPLRGLAALVGYSRIHTGVHYPGDVVGGAVIGGVTADLTSSWINRN
jgi:undecaprenyl-diphosphatase